MGGFSAVNGDPLNLGSVMNANNASFDGSERGGCIQQNGQLWIGSAGSPHIVVGTLTAGAGISITNGPGSITITNTGGGGGGGLSTLIGNTGSATQSGGAITIIGTNGITVTGNNISTLTISTSNSAVLTLSDDVNTTVTPSSNNIQLVGHINEQGPSVFSTVVAGTHLLNINPMSPARWIVDPLGFNGTHTTIASAIASATSGDTIILLPGTYTENPTLKAGVNITAQPGDWLVPNVTILGKCTFTGAGTVSISNVQLQTNSDYCLAVTGSSASVVYLNNCYINVANNTGINFSSSSSSSQINIFYSLFQQAEDNISYFSHSAAGFILLNNCRMSWGGSYTNAACTCSSGSVSVDYCIANLAITTSGTGFVNMSDNFIDTLTVTCLTLGGSGTSNIKLCSFNSGSATAIVANSPVGVFDIFVSSSNTNAISGSGTLTYSGISYGTSYAVSTTTISRQVLDGGNYKGNNSGSAVSAGCIGEQIRATIGSASKVSVSNSTATNITSISLTAGIWDVSAICEFTGVTTGTLNRFSISTTSVTEGTYGDNLISMANNIATGADQGLSIPAYRITLSSTTSVYMVAYMIYTVGSGAAYGRISATRVG